MVISTESSAICRGADDIRFSIWARVCPQGSPSRLAASAIVVIGHEARAAATAAEERVGVTTTAGPAIVARSLGVDHRARWPMDELHLKTRSALGADLH